MSCVAGRERQEEVGCSSNQGHVSQAQEAGTQDEICGVRGCGDAGMRRESGAVIGALVSFRLFLQLQCEESDKKRRVGDMPCNSRAVSGVRRADRRKGRREDKGLAKKSGEL